MPRVDKGMLCGGFILRQAQDEKVGPDEKGGRVKRDAG